MSPSTRLSVSHVCQKKKRDMIYFYFVARQMLKG